MPNFDSVAALNAAKAFLDGLSIETVIGVPESFAAGVSAYVADGPRQIRDRGTNDYMEQTQTIFCCIGYRVNGAEANIELALAAKGDEIVRRWVLDRRGGLGFFAVSQSAELDFSIQNDPRYQILAGQEFRIYPFLIRFSQREVIT